MSTSAANVLPTGMSALLTPRATARLPSGSRRRECQIVTPVVRPTPTWETAGRSFRGIRTRHDAKRTRAGKAARPPLPQLGPANRFTPSLDIVIDPHELQIRILKEEAAVGSPLPRMRVGRSFREPETNECVGFRSPFRAKEDQVIEDEWETGRGY